jgi:hypothetical protein
MSADSMDPKVGQSPDAEKKKKKRKRKNGVEAEGKAI